jgi:nuclear protein localization family protein 4
MRSLNELDAPDVQTSRQRTGDSNDAHRRLELAKWLSDWHLVTFLGTCGLLSEVSKKKMFPISPSPFPAHTLGSVFLGSRFGSSAFLLTF